MQRGYDREYHEGLTKHLFEKFGSRVGHLLAQIGAELCDFTSQLSMEVSHLPAQISTELSHFPAESGVEIGHIALGGNLMPERVVGHLSGGFGGFLRKPALIAEFARQFQGIDDRHRSAFVFDAQDAS